MLYKTNKNLDKYVLLTKNSLSLHQDRLYSARWGQSCICAIFADSTAVVGGAVLRKYQKTSDEDRYNNLS